MKELIMCYRIPADAEKDVSTLSSEKESVFTPREDVGTPETRPSMSESGLAATFHKLLAPFGKDKGGIWQTDDSEISEMKPSADTREIERID